VHGSAKLRVLSSVHAGVQQHHFRKQTMTC